jgi:hypothetical protein
MASEVVSFQAEKIIDLDCYKFYWLHRRQRCVLIYKNDPEKGYVFHTTTQDNTIWDIGEFYNFVNNYTGQRWGDDGKTPQR